MGFRDSIVFVKRLWILLFLFMLIIPNKSIAQTATLKLDRIWALDIQGNVTALRLADSDGDGISEILVGVWEGDSGYIQIFEGHNGLLSGTSESIHKPDHEVIDMDVGDIDGDRNLELLVGVTSVTYDVYYNKSFIYVFKMAELRLEWDTWIQGQLRSMEVEDIDQDDTAEVFLGTAYSWYSENIGHSGYDCFLHYSGRLYYMNGGDATPTIMDASSGYWKLLADDIDQHSYKEILCGTFWGFGESYCSWDGSCGGQFREIALTKIINQDTSIYILSQLYNNTHYSDDYPATTPYVTSLAVGNCDLDEAKEIVSHIDSGEEDWPTGLVLSVTDASTGIVENSSTCDDAGVALAVFDINAQPPDEILIAHRNGTIEAVDGMTFDTVAISDPLPAISFFAFGDVTGDPMPEVCISDRDSLFVYTTPVTAVGDENQETSAVKFIVNQNYPNPFNTQTTIRYYLSQSSRVKLRIYNIKGQKVKTLVDNSRPAGYQSVTWDGSDKNGSEVASGVYFYRVKTDCSEETKKMVLLK